MRRIGALVVLLAIAGLSAACGSSGKSAKTTASTMAASSTSTSTSTSATTGPTASGSTTPVSVASTQPAAHLVAVRAARQESADRIVFEFSDRVPGYKVAYATKPILNTEGREVQVGGTAALVVRMEAASGFNQTTAQQTYTGPKQLQPSGTQAVVNLAQVEDFEAVLSWAVGVKSQVGFRVSALASPPRLVIDLGS